MTTAACCRICQARARNIRDIRDELRERVFCIYDQLRHSPLIRDRIVAISPRSESLTTTWSGQTVACSPSNPLPCAVPAATQELEFGKCFGENAAPEGKISIVLLKRGKPRLCGPANAPLPDRCCSRRLATRCGPRGPCDAPARSARSDSATERANPGPPSDRILFARNRAAGFCD
jgi:hypothetical protein